MLVVLEWYEGLIASIVGLLRFFLSRASGFPCARPSTEPLSLALSRDIKGAMAEMAFAKLAGCYWPPSVGTFKKVGDVGVYDVRQTDYRTGKLIIRTSDPNDRIAVLMTGSYPEFCFAGWIESGGAKKLDEFKVVEPGKAVAWFIPQACLFHDLPRS